MPGQPLRAKLASVFKKVRHGDNKPTAAAQITPVQQPSEAHFTTIEPGSIGHAKKIRGQHQEVSPTVQHLRTMFGVNYFGADIPINPVQ